MNRVRQLSAAGLLGIVMIFELAAFALLSLRDESFDYKALIFAGGLIVVLLLQYIIILWISKYADRFILVIANLLAGIGMIVQYRLSYEVAFKQLVWFGIGIVAMIVCVLLMRAPKFFKTMDIPLMALSIAMLGVLLVIGTENGGAKNWIKLGGISVQPSAFAGGAGMIKRRRLFLVSRQRALSSSLVSTACIYARNMFEFARFIDSIRAETSAPVSAEPAASDSSE